MLKLDYACKVAVAIGVAGVCATLAACNSLEDPAKVCAAPETQDQVRELITQEAMKAANLMKGDAPNLTVSAAQLKAMIKFDLVTLTSFDKTTKKTVCSTQASINVPADLKSMMANPLVAASAPMLSGGQQTLTYNRQPSADGQQSVFGIEQDATPVATALAFLAVAMTNKAAAAAQPPVPAAPPVVDPTASDTAAPAASDTPVQ